VAEEDTNNDNGLTIVERWLEEQQRWQQTVLTYLDSMVKDEDFLVHLGNAMRGSLLAGKPYPTAPLPAAVDADAKREAPEDDRLDRVLFALHQIEGQLEDLRDSVEELRAGKAKKNLKKKSKAHKDKARE
jgi:hypothetical protein